MTIYINKIQLQKAMVIKICPSGQYFWKNKWRPFTNLDEVFLLLFGKTVKDSKVKPFDINPGIKREFNIIKNGKKVKVKLEVTLSPKVAKENSQYFEGILQVKNIDNGIVDYIHNEVEKQRKKGIFITKEKITKNRADFQITDQTYMKSLANKLQRVFGGTISLNPTLFSKNKQSGKELFRLTLLLNLPTIRKNDIIVHNGTVWKVNSVQNKINVISLHGKKTSLPYKDYKILEKFETRVTKIQPEVEIMDPETYQSVDVRNPKKLKVDQKVKVVFHEGWWLADQ